MKTYNRLRVGWHHTNGDAFTCDKCSKGFFEGTLNLNTCAALCYDCYYNKLKDKTEIGHIN